MLTQQRFKGDSKWFGTGRHRGRTANPTYHSNALHASKLPNACIWCCCRESDFALQDNNPLCAECGANLSCSQMLQANRHVDDISLCERIEFTNNRRARMVHTAAVGLLHATVAVATAATAPRRKAARAVSVKFRLYSSSGLICGELRGVVVVLLLHHPLGELK